VLHTSSALACCFVAPTPRLCVSRGVCGSFELLDGVVVIILPREATSVGIIAIKRRVVGHRVEFGLVVAALQVLQQQSRSVTVCSV